jgi:hypothetical protein
MSLHFWQFISMCRRHRWQKSPSGPRVKENDCRVDLWSFHWAQLRTVWSNLKLSTYCKAIKQKQRPNQNIWRSRLNISPNYSTRHIKFDISDTNTFKLFSFPNSIAVLIKCLEILMKYDTLTKGGSTLKCSFVSEVTRISPIMSINDVETLLILTPIFSFQNQKEKNGRFFHQPCENIDTWKQKCGKFYNTVWNK